MTSSPLYVVGVCYLSAAALALVGLALLALIPMVIVLVVWVHSVRN